MGENEIFKQSTSIYKYKIGSDTSSSDYIDTTGNFITSDIRKQDIQKQSNDTSISITTLNTFGLSNILFTKTEDDKYTSYSFESSSIKPLTDSDKTALGNNFPFTIETNKITFTKTNSGKRYSEIVNEYFENFHEKNALLTTSKVENVNKFGSLLDSDYTVSALRGAEGTKRVFYMIGGNNHAVVVESGSNNADNVVIDAGFKLVRMENAPIYPFPRIFYIIRGIPIELRKTEMSNRSAIYSAPDIKYLNKKEFLASVESVRVIGVLDKNTPGSDDLSVFEIYTGKNSFLGSKNTGVIETSYGTVLANCNIISNINRNLHTAIKFT